MSDEIDRKPHIDNQTELVETVFERMRSIGSFSVLHDEWTWRINFEPHPAAGLARAMYTAEAHWLWNTVANLDRQIVEDHGRWPVRTNPGNDLDPRFE